VETRKRTLWRRSSDPSWQSSVRCFSDCRAGLRRYRGWNSRHKAGAARATPAGAQSAVLAAASEGSVFRPSLRSRERRARGSMDLLAASPHSVVSPVVSPVRHPWPGAAARRAGAPDDRMACSSRDSMTTSRRSACAAAFFRARLARPKDFAPLPPVDGAADASRLVATFSGLSAWCREYSA
jgi:hypothetical protein